MATRLPSPLAMSATAIDSQGSRLRNIGHHVGEYRVFDRSSRDYAIFISYRPDTGATRFFFCRLEFLRLFWDTAGQENFRAISSSYYHGTNGVVVSWLLQAY
ncbi:hypothetical protein EJ110_NYTH51796 [Nymphaea thermarum]|nr:hypothetical protein EJ110_NYTH51796 [Nymphaea thermarum]